VTIESLEKKHAEINAQIAYPEFYQQEQSFIGPVLEELAKIDADLQLAYARWDELEALTE
jgi:ATP-binding cassette subfamily F protein uup